MKKARGIVSLILVLTCILIPSSALATRRTNGINGQPFVFVYEVENRLIWGSVRMEMELAAEVTPAFLKTIHYVDLYAGIPNTSLYNPMLFSVNSVSIRSFTYNGNTASGSSYPVFVNPDTIKATRRHYVNKTAGSEVPINLNGSVTGWLSNNCIPMACNLDQSASYK